MRRAKAIIFSVLMVVSMIAMGFGGLAAADGGAPSGTVGVPSENIDSDLPPNTPMQEAADEIEEAGVYASDNASTLEVIVTAPGRAEEKYSGGHLHGGGPVAIVFRDDENHAGREVAVSADALEDALGYKPEAVFGAHEDGEQWALPVRYEDGYAVFEVPHFSENTVTFSGGITIDGDEAADGSTWEYKLDQPGDADNFSISLEGVENTEPYERSGKLGSEESLPLSIGGTTTPRDQQLTFEGTETTESFADSGSASDGSSSTIEIPGNVDPENVEIEVQGDRNETDGSDSASGLSDGETFEVDAGGNLQPEDQEITFEGVENTEEFSDSGSDSDGTSTSVDIPGNVDPEDVEIVVYGDRTESSETDSATHSDGDSTTIDVSGNVDPEDTEVTFEGDRSETTQSETETAQAGDSIPFSVEGNVDPENEDVTLVGERDESAAGDSGSGTSGTVDVDGNVDPEDGEVYVDLTQKTGEWTSESYSLDVGDSATVSLDVSEIDTLDKIAVRLESNYCSYDSTVGVYDGDSTFGDPDWGEGTNTGCDMDTTYHGAQSVDVSDQDTYQITIGHDDSGHDSTTLDIDGSNHKAYGPDPPSSVDATVDDTTQTVDTNTWESVDLSQGSNDIEIEDGDYETDWELDWTEVWKTEDPSVEVDGQTVSYSGILDEGETHTESVSLSHSSDYSASVDTTHKVGVEIDYMEVTAVENPSLGGDVSASHSGILDTGETATVSVSGLSTGSNTIDTSLAAGPSTSWTLDYTEVTAVEDPAVDVTGDGTADTSHSGILDSGESATLTLTDGDLESGTQSLDWSAGSSEGWSWDIDGTALHHTADPSVDINGDGSVDASHSGILSPGESVTLDVDEIETGSQSVETDLTHGDVDATADYTEVTAVEAPAVDVTCDGSDDHSYSDTLDSGQSLTWNVSDGDLSSGSESLDWSSSSATSWTWDLNGTARYHTENPAVDITGDGTNDWSYAGMLAAGETQTYNVTEFNTTTENITAETAGGSKTIVEANMTQVSESKDPTVIVNGEETEDVGTLEPGETVDLTVWEEWLEENNTVVIDMADVDGPSPLVDMDYSHTAVGTSTTTEIDATSWKESYNVSHTFPDSQTGAEMYLPFVDEVHQISDLEMRVNGSDWSSVQDYTLDGNNLTVQLGDVDPSTTVEVRTTGQKVRTTNGEVKVTDPTVEGDDLDSKIEVVDVNDQDPLEIDVSSTEQWEWLHYSTDESWGENAISVVEADRSQTLRLEGANVGSTTRVKTTDMEVKPQTGEAEVTVEDPDEPTFSVAPGPSKGDDVEIVYHDTVTGQKYALHSQTDNRDIDTATASSPVTFSTTDSSITYIIEQRESGGGSSAVTAPIDESGGSGLSLVMLLLGVSVSIGGFWFVGRRFTDAEGVRDNSLLLVGGTLVSVLALEFLTPGSFLAQLTEAFGGAASGVLATGIGAVTGGVAILVVLWQVDERTAADVPLPVFVLAGVGAFLLISETLLPGSVLAALSSGLEEVGPLIWIALLGGGAILVRQYIQARAAPDEEVTLEINNGGN